MGNSQHDPLEDEILARANSLGREVILSGQAWRHVLEGHEEMKGRITEVVDAIETNEYRFGDRRFPQREHLYRSGVFRRGWLRVIVDFGESPAIIVHAQRIGSLPSHLERL